MTSGGSLGAAQSFRTEQEEAVFLNSADDGSDLSACWQGASAVYRAPRCVDRRQVTSSTVRAQRAYGRMSLGCENVNLHSRNVGHPAFLPKANQCRYLFEVRYYRTSQIIQIYDLFITQRWKARIAVDFASPCRPPRPRNRACAGGQEGAQGGHDAADASAPSHRSTAAARCEHQKPSIGAALSATLRPSCQPTSSRSSASGFTNRCQTWSRLSSRLFAGNNSTPSHSGPTISFLICCFSYQLRCPAPSRRRIDKRTHPEAALRA